MGKYGNESKYLEFKQEYSKNALKVIDSFLNTEGGNIFFPVDDEGNPVKVDDLNELQLQITNALQDAIEPNPVIYLDTSQDNNEIIRVEVQEGDNKPYYLKSKGLNSKGVFIRKGSASYPATLEEIKAMIKNSDGTKFEELRSNNQNLTFCEAEKIMADRNVDLKAGMETLGLIQIDTGLFTNLALILSDQNPFTIKVATFADEDMTEFISRKEFSGSILKQIDEVINFIELINKNTFNIEKQYRAEKSDYPIEAIREAVINSVIHRDYFFEGPTLIKSNQKFLDVTSLGSLLKGLQISDLRRGVHMPRNPKLANLFYRLELIEAYGTGIIRIFSQYKNEEIEPEINLTDNLFQIRLPNRNALHINLNNNPNSNISENSDVVKNHNLNNNITTKVSVSERKILTYLEKVGASNTKEVQNKTELKQSTYYKARNQLINKNLITFVDNDNKNLKLTELGKTVLKNL